LFLFFKAYPILGALQWNVVGLQHSRKIPLAEKSWMGYLFYQIRPRLAPVSKHGEMAREG